MPTSPARFRISIKDQHTGTGLKVELIDAPGIWGERRYRIRLNGRPAAKVPEATLSEVFNRLRRWTVNQAERNVTGPHGRAMKKRAVG
jgi:hypothetical protein